MKKRNVKNQKMDWQIPLMLLVAVILLTAMTINIASIKEWTVKYMIYHYFVPAFVGSTIFVLGMGLIFIGLEKRRKRVLKER